MKGRVYDVCFLAVLFVGIIGTLCNATRADNPCPQPTKSNPIVPSMYYAHPSNCAKFYQCANGNPVEMNCPKGTVYNDQYSTCVHAGMEKDSCTPENPFRECELGNVEFIPHPTECHQYYNCSDTSRRGMYSKLQKYQMECTYPEVFDIRLKRCVGYEQAVCGKDRRMPTWECQYVRLQCPSSHCIPCAVRYPSCLNREDGSWSHPQKQWWSRSYVECLNQRAIAEPTCPLHQPTNTVQLFHSQQRRCAPLWETVFGPISCEGKGNGIYSVKEMKIISYKCPERNFFYCVPPYYIHQDITRCTPI